ncbi:lantibiotic dehydratase [Kitasatospora sp. Root187]|nr:lantibiotic dehydratase [Kitasatospora sp. Root187]KRB72576.1 lantibiotic dehydratase [Kitasatospora sp. Root187]
MSGGALLRATTDPGGLDLPRDVDLTGDQTTALHWLESVWQRAEVRDALSVASPGLCRRLAEILADERTEPRQLQRAVLSLASYALRWQGRATPFGLFAGIAPVRIGTTSRVEWGGKHEVRLRADADWTAEVITRLERDPQVQGGLKVVINNTGHLRGDRWVVPGRPADGTSVQMSPVEVAVRHSGPVAAALEAATTPIRFDDLRDHLAAKYPAAIREQLSTLLAGLLEQGVLVSSLWAPMTEPDALAHLCTELTGLPGVRALLDELGEIRDQLAQRATTAGVPVPAALLERMRAVSGAAPVPVVVDTVLDCDVQIPEHVVTEAEDAVAVLYRLSAHPYGYPQWRDYHRKFRARYGVGALVPVIELVADSGLGLPADYLGSATGRAARPLTGRDEKLLALVQRAMLDGSGEIVLTPAVIEDLTGGTPEGSDALIPSPRAEVSFEIHAQSTADLDRGAFRLVVTGAPRPGSSMAGRFAHLLTPEDRAALDASYGPGDPQAVAAQLSFAPRRRRNDNVTRTAAVTEHVIPLAEHREAQESVIELADLAVTADARQFYLVQLSTGRRVEPRVAHALEAGVHTPALARFLAEITTARCPVYQALDFGAAAHMPYLPRVRYRRTVLSPARWLLTAHDLQGDSWEQAFDTWRHAMRVPDHVTVMRHDQRLPLDLTHPVHRQLLRTTLSGTRHLELREAPSPTDLAWIGRSHELLLPLAQFTAPPARPARPAVPAAGPALVRSAAAVHLPGQSTVLHAQLLGHPARHNEVLTQHLPALLGVFESEKEGVPVWWFRRHRELARPDADQHLALYLALPDPGAYGQAAAHLAAWADRLRRSRLLAGMSLATYEPQVGRYGHGPALDAAHAVFAADSAAALAQIHIAEKAGLAPQAMAAGSMTDLAAAFAPAAGQGLEWLVREIPREGGPLDRSLGDQALDFADLRRALWALPGGETVSAAWQARTDALANYCKHLSSDRDPLTVLRSLLHLHHVRAVGVDPDQEKITNRLVRACAQRHLALGRRAT